MMTLAEQYNIILFRKKFTSMIPYTISAGYAPPGYTFLYRINNNGNIFDVYIKDNRLYYFTTKINSKISPTVRYLNYNSYRTNSSNHKYAYEFETLWYKLGQGEDLVKWYNNESRAVYSEFISDLIDFVYASNPILEYESQYQFWEDYGEAGQYYSFLSVYNYRPSISITGYKDLSDDSYFISNYKSYTVIQKYRESYGGETVINNSRTPQQWANYLYQLKNAFDDDNYDIRFLNEDSRQVHSYIYDMLAPYWFDTGGDYEEEPEE